MTIGQFAELCSCNPQTLRYYDRVGLLKPAKADPWTGYRSYEEDQALSFVKIRNLQKAGFTIGEIKLLLDQDHPTILEALDEKLRETEKRLREIRAIRESYHTEMEEMRNRIAEVREKLLKVMAGYDAAEEFGITPEEYGEILRRIEGFDFSGESRWDGNGTRGTGEARLRQLLDSADRAVIYEKHGWLRAKDFLEEMPTPADGGEYDIFFQLTGREEDLIPFANVLLNLLLKRSPGKSKTLACDMGLSADGQNHIWMFRKK